MTTAAKNPAASPTTSASPTLLDLAERFEAACASLASAEEASRLATSARDAAMAARGKATTRLQEQQRLALHGRGESGVPEAREVLKKVVADLTRLESESRSAFHAANHARCDRDAAGEALARAMHARGVRFARWGDRLVVDRSVHPDPDETKYPISYQTGSTKAVRLVPPTEWAVEVVPLPDIQSL